MTLGSLAIIAGTGFYAYGSLESPRVHAVETEYGPVDVTSGTLHGRVTHFVSRHGATHSVPPHMINYRAIIQALVNLGVTQIMAINVVGGIGLAPGDLVIVDDFIDFTHQRPVTFFDGSTPEGVVHVDMGSPYDPHLRRAWRSAADDVGAVVVEGGVYGAFEGPRFETRAEIRMARAAGVTVVGMTGVPEVVLAAERGIAYASMCLVANPAAGLGTEPITVIDVEAVVAAGAGTVTAILDRAAAVLAAQE